VYIIIVIIYLEYIAVKRD